MDDIDQDKHDLALTRFQLAENASREEREQALNDRRFATISGAQWEGKYGELYKKKIKIEVNKVQSALMRTVTDYRTNRISATFYPKPGSNSGFQADMLTDILRADRADSNAEEAFDSAFEEGAAGGMGAWRLSTVYEDEYDPDDERQRIVFEPIYDADSVVFFDPNSKRYDKSDAEYCFVLTAMTREAFEDEYDESPTEWPRTNNDNFDWFDGDNVYVAEYYEAELTDYKIHFYQTIDEREERYTDDELDAETLARLKAVGTKKVGERIIKRRRIHKYIMSGGGILEDNGFIAGSEIPVVPFYGKRWYIDGIERFSGIVRLAKDSQRTYNMMISNLADIASRSGVRRPIMTPEQVAGHESVWANASVDNPAYLPINPVTDQSGNESPIGPVGYDEPPSIPPAMAALLQIGATDIAEVLGNQQQGDVLQANTSGIAVELVQTRLDGVSLIYMSNMARSVKRSAQIWFSMMREVYVERGREMKGLDESGQAKTVILGTDLESESDSIGKFDVRIEVGPTSDSRRRALTRTLSTMLPVVADPQDQQVISAAIMRNIEGEGMGPIQEYYRRKLVQMGVEEPNDEDKQRIEQAEQSQQPDPRDQYLQAEAERSAALARKAEADIEETIADADLKRAKTAETLQKVGMDSQGLVPLRGGATQPQ